MSRKALFFDIDGTLLSEKTHTVPDSAVRALEVARARGHKVFINSGRVISMMDEIRGEVEVDGYLCGCGTYILVDNQVLYAHQIPHERGVEIRRNMKKFNIDGILEAAEAFYYPRAKSRVPDIERLRAKYGDGVYALEDECYDYDKFCIFTDELSQIKEFLDTLKPDIDVIDRGDGFYECVPAGHSKATAIEMILKKYGIEKKDAYVFGDSANDLPMFEYSDNAVLMGHHDPDLEQYATFITKDVEDDGVEYAMKELGII